ncbi:hypothetical protein K2P97_09525 [bacterium]|nr:hypothetical protein [bacterium]
MKNTILIITILCSTIAYGDLPAPPKVSDAPKSDDASRVRTPPKPGPGEKQLTCDEIDKLEFIPLTESSSVGEATSTSLNSAIKKINASIQYKKDFCNGKIKPEL